MEQQTATNSFIIFFFLSATIYIHCVDSDVLSKSELEVCVLDTTDYEFKLNIINYTLSNTKQSTTLVHYATIFALK